MVKLDTADDVLEWVHTQGEPYMAYPDDKQTATYLAECVRLRQEFEKLANSLEMSGGLAAPKPTWIGQLRDAMRSCARRQ